MRLRHGDQDASPEQLSAAIAEVLRDADRDEAPASHGS
jgi:hypothetical protein